MTDLLIACADVGSVAEGNFGWAAKRPGVESAIERGQSMESLVDAVVQGLASNGRVALGFECPLFVPLRKNPRDLTSQRVGEKGRPWSAGAGCGSLATGLVQVAWTFDRLAQAGLGVRPTLHWEEFCDGGSRLLIWEAFVSGRATAKGGGTLHVEDAELAVRVFESALPDVPAFNGIQEDVVFSLVGAALLRTGLYDDSSVLAESCLVLRV